MRCHYDVLGLPLDATNDDIKKAYRKSALQWHPDKHSDSNREEANKRFLEIQDAYETLSNDQERAWYDSHREVLINGGTPGNPDDAVYLFNIYPYFTSSCFKGFGDDENGFYTIYREMFSKIADEDRQHYDEEVDIPEFGDSKSDYDTIVAPFYSFWLSYCTPRSFVWCEKHDVRDANDRYVRRVMEKENKKLKDKAKKERNEEVRKVVEFVRKKDKRVEEYKRQLEEKNVLAQKKAKEKKELDRQRRVEQMKTYVEPEWSTVDQRLEELELEENRKEMASSKRNKLFKDENEETEEAVEENSGDGDMDEDELSDEFDESLFCVACNKSFKSAKSFQNHENSKKHKDNVQLLKKLMKDEDENLFLNKSTNDPEEEQEEVVKSTEKSATKNNKLSKKQKKRQKQNRQKLNEDSSENDTISEAEQEETCTPAEVKNSNEINEEHSFNKPNNQLNENTNENQIEEEVEKEEGKAKVPLVCSVCQEEFDSRNKLFSHIQKERHAAPKIISDQSEKPLSHNAMKKNKRLAKEIAKTKK